MEGFTALHVSFFDIYAENWNRLTKLPYLCQTLEKW